MFHPKKLLVYVAGPFTKPHQLPNIRNAIKAGDQIAAMGFGVFIPHLNYSWELVCGSHDYEFWMDQDAQVLYRCDVLFLLPGESSGAEREVKLAETLNIPVFSNLEDLAAWKEIHDKENEIAADEQHG